MRPASYREEGPCCRNCSNSFVLATRPGDAFIVHHFCKHSGIDDKSTSDSKKLDLSAQPIPIDYVWAGKHMVDPKGFCDEYSKK